MNLLLDTQLVLWTAFWPNKIPPQAGEAIKRASSVYISSVSVFEIALKASIGKLDIPSASSKYDSPHHRAPRDCCSRASMYAGPTILQPRMPTRSTAYCSRRQSSSRFTSSARTRISLDTGVSL
jgi:hypothetical protein